MPDTSVDFIHRYLPPHDTPDGTTLLLLHGTGGDENDLLALGPMLHERAGLLSPRGKVLENGMPRFFRRLAEGVFDIPDLIARTNELADWVAVAAQRYGFDPERVVAVGFSNGANIAAAMLLLRPAVLRAAVLLSPMVPLEPEPRPKLPGTAVFIGAGRSDPMVPASGAERLAELLRSLGANVKLEWHEGGHMIAPREIASAREWLRDVTSR